MIEAEAVAQLGETPLTKAMPGGCTSRCWLIETADGVLTRCLLFDARRGLIDVAGDGVNDRFPPPPSPQAP